VSEPDITRMLAGIVTEYVDRIHEELAARWYAWKLDLARTEVHEVIGGLMARQVTLASQLAEAPPIWNGHIAPLVLRSMTDVYITFAWIWLSPLERSRQFILYGLGQEKLHLEHLKADVERKSGDPSTDPMVTALERWLNAQRFTFLTEVNVGSWSGTDTRKMAEEADCLDLYRFAYAPFSQATHSMWPHLLKYNLTHCTNPLHRYHRVPAQAEMGVDPDYLYRAAKYVRKTFRLFDKQTGVSVDIAPAFDSLVERLRTLDSEADRPKD
jgi:hypothetical protein